MASFLPHLDGEFSHDLAMSAFKMIKTNIATVLLSKMAGVYDTLCTFQRNSLNKQHG